MASLFSLTGEPIHTNNSEVVQKNIGYFDHTKSEVSIPQENFPENTLIYVKQARKTLVSNREVYMCDCEILGQIIEIPDIEFDVNHELKSDEVRYIRTDYDIDTVELKGVYMTIG